MGKCQLNHFTIKTEQDLENLIKKLEQEWGRPLFRTARRFLYQKLRGYISKNAVKQETSRQSLELTKTDKRILHTQGAAAMLKAKRERLKTHHEKLREEMFRRVK